MNGMRRIVGAALFGLAAVVTGPGMGDLQMVAIVFLGAIVATFARRKLRSTHAWRWFASSIGAA